MLALKNPLKSLFKILSNLKFFNVDILELTSNVSLVEIAVKPEWVGQNLIELNLRKKYSINVIAIQHDNDVTTEIDPNKPLEQTMKLIVVANRNKLEKLR